MGRPRKLDAKPYHGADGYWHAWKTVDGRRITRKVKDPDASDKGKREVLKRLREAIDEIDAARIQAAADAAVAAALPPKPTGRYTVHSWLRYWLAEIIFPNTSYNNHKDCRHVVESMIIPNIEDVPLADLEVEHVEKMIAALRLTGSDDKPWRAYDRLRLALNAAEKRQKSTGLRYNPCKGVDPAPSRPTHEVDPLSMAEVRQVLEQAQALDRNAARWTVALALGLRQGEALALTWGDVDLDRGLIWVRENTYRRKWVHGCTDPHACGAKYHRYNERPCPGTGVRHDRYHSRGCPPPKAECQPGCTAHAAQCPQGHGGVDEKGVRQPGGKARKPPKSRAGKRVIRLPEPLVAELRTHKAAQAQERIAAGDRWERPLGRRPQLRQEVSNLVFATKWGRELNERDDWGQFVELLERSGVRRTRLHDSRHFAATMLLLKKIDPLVVMYVMGWSSPAMLKRYQHVLDEMRAEVAQAVTGALWDESGPSFATPSAAAKITDLSAERLKRR